MEANATPALLPVQIVGQTLTISSVPFAEGLGIQHKNLLATINTHRRTIENDFGAIAFETLKSDNQSLGGRNVRIAHLTEEQALFLAALSKNSPVVIQFKVVLVRSFVEIRRQLGQPQSNPNIERILLEQGKLVGNLQKENRQLHQQLNEIKAALNPLALSDVQVPKGNVNNSRLRSEIVSIVERYCETRGYSLEETWHYLYKRLMVQNGIDARKLYRSVGSDDLDALEKHNLLDKLYAIVSLDLA